MIHFRGLDLGNEIKDDQDLEIMYVNMNQDEHQFDTVSYSVGDWKDDSKTPFELDDNEDYCDWILRNAYTQQIVFKMHFEKYTAPPVIRPVQGNIVADGFAFTAPVVVPVIHNNVDPIPVSNQPANGNMGLAKLAPTASIFPHKKEAPVNGSLTSLGVCDAFRKFQAAGGMFVHVGEYGWIRFVINKYKDETRAEHEGEILANVTLHEQGTISEIRASVATDIHIRFTLE